MKYTPGLCAHLCAVFAALSLTGCATNPSREDIGTVTGAVVGGVVGSALGGTAATIGGAAAGGYIGNQIGKELDRNHRRR